MLVVDYQEAIPAILAELGAPAVPMVCDVEFSSAWQGIPSLLRRAAMPKRDRYVRVVGTGALRRTRAGADVVRGRHPRRPKRRSLRPNGADSVVCHRRNVPLPRPVIERVNNAGSAERRSDGFSNPTTRLRAL